MDLYDGYSKDSAERIERTLRVVWGEVAPRTYADVPTYDDMPTYGAMESTFGGKENWPKRNNPTEFPDEPRFRPTYGPLPAKDWNAAANPAAFLLPPKDWSKAAEVIASHLPPKDWGSVSKPEGPSGGP